VVEFNLRSIPQADTAVVVPVRAVAANHQCRRRREAERDRTLTWCASRTWVGHEAEVVGAGRLTGGGVVSVVTVGSAVSECVLVIGTRVMVAEVGVASVVRLPPNASHQPGDCGDRQYGHRGGDADLRLRVRDGDGEKWFGADWGAAVTLIAEADAARASSPADGQRLAGSLVMPHRITASKEGWRPGCLTLGRGGGASRCALIRLGRIPRRYGGCPVRHSKSTHVSE